LNNPYREPGKTDLTMEEKSLRVRVLDKEISNRLMDIETQLADLNIETHVKLGKGDKYNVTWSQSLGGDWMLYYGDKLVRNLNAGGKLRVLELIDLDIKNIVKTAHKALDERLSRRQQALLRTKRKLK